MKKILNQANPPRRRYPFAKDDINRIILKDSAGASMVLCKNLPYTSCRILVQNINDFLAKHDTKLNGKFAIVKQKMKKN